MTTDPEALYALAPAADVSDDAWKKRNTWTDCYAGKGGSIDLCTAEQLASAAEASFAGRSDVLLLAFSVERMREEADMQFKLVDGAAHIGEPIPYACLQSAPARLALAEGKHVFPLLGSLEEIAAAKKQAAYDEGYESDAASSDGLPAFDQHRFDLDDENGD